MQSRPVLMISLDWLRSGSQTFRTWFKPDFKPSGIRFSRIPEPEPLSRFRFKQRPNSNLKFEPRTPTPMEIDKPTDSGCAQRSDRNDNSGCAQQSDHDDDSGCAHQSFNDNNDYNPASDFDHYQEDPEFDNGGAGIQEDTVMDQRDRNTRDMSLRDSSTAGLNTQDTSPGEPNSKEPQAETSITVSEAQI